MKNSIHAKILTLVALGVGSVLADDFPGAEMRLRLSEAARSLRINGVRATADVVATSEAGRSVEMYVTTENDDSFGPVVVWVDSGNGEIVKIDSIASVNQVINRAKLLMVKENVSPEVAVSMIRNMLIRQYVNYGVHTGIPIVGQYGLYFSRALGKTVEPNRFVALWGELQCENIAVGNEEWSATWAEVDRMGGAERVIARGTLNPLAVKTVTREIIFEAGAVPGEILNIVDFNRLGKNEPTGQP